MNFNNRYEPVLKITARTKEEATKLLFEKYGYDYQIVNKKPVLKGGFLGFGQHEEIEFSYILSNRNSMPSEPAERVQIQERPVLQEKPVTVRTSSSQPESFEKSKENILKNFQVDVSKVLANAQLADVATKLAELSDKLDNVSSSSSSTVSASENETIEKIRELLLDNEFSSRFANMIIEKIKNTFSITELEDFNLVQKQVVDWIGESIEIYHPKVYRKPRVIILVGPTGVGKTTTLVKLATNYMLTHNKEMGYPPVIRFVTTDSMRVGAMEQLERFSDIFNRKVLKAENMNDLKQIYNEYKDNSDAFFIDTSGYSPNDASHIGAMKEMLNVPGIDAEIFLTVTASTKSRDLQNIMQNYEIFGYNSVIITKCDETGQYGNVLSVLNQRHKSVAYVTDGQNAAKCLNKANVISFLIRLEGFEIDRTHIEDKFGDQ